MPGKNVYNFVLHSAESVPVPIKKERKTAMPLIYFFFSRGTGLFPEQISIGSIQTRLFLLPHHPVLFEDNFEFKTNILVTSEAFFTSSLTRLYSFSSIYNLFFPPSQVLLTELFYPSLNPASFIYMHQDKLFCLPAVASSPKLSASPLLCTRFYPVLNTCCTFLTSLLSFTLLTLALFSCFYCGRISPPFASFPAYFPGSVTSFSFAFLTSHPPQELSTSINQTTEKIFTATA